MNSENQEFLNTDEFKTLLENANADFLDFGCSTGGSIAFAQQRFGGRNGVGIDIDADKVKKAQQAGFEAALYDINNIPDEKLARFVVMSHFLEHVPSPFDVKAFIQKACTISSEFVYIQQPFFDADSYLFRKGLKFFSSDWSGHPNRMTSLELWLVLRDLREAGLPITFSLHGYKRIVNSEDPYVHPITSPIDQHGYDEKRHPPKDSSIEFDGNVFQELIGLITLPGCDHVEMLKKLRITKTLIDHTGEIRMESDEPVEAIQPLPPHSLSSFSRVKNKLRTVRQGLFNGNN